MDPQILQNLAVSTARRKVIRKKGVIHLYHEFVIIEFIFSLLSVSCNEVYKVLK